MARRPTTDPKKYRHPDGGWRVKIAGRSYRLGRDEDQAEAKRRQLVGAWLAGGGPGAVPPAVAVPASSLTVALALAEYAVRGVRPGINKSQRGRIDTAIEAAAALFADLPAESFGALELKRVRAALLKRAGKPKRNHRRGAPQLARRYVNSLIGCLKTAWDWCASERLVPAWRAHELRTVTGLREGDGGRETPAVLPPPESDVDAALRCMSGPVRAMVLLQRLTGMRPGEVRAMRRGELSTCPAEILTPANALPCAAFAAGDGTMVWVYAPEQHKTRRKRKPRLVALGPQAQAVLSPFILRGPLLEVPGGYLFRPADAPRAGRPLGKPPRECYTATAYNLAVRRACRRAGAPVWQPGQLRHALATATFADDPLTAMSILGHSHVTMTSYYAAANLRRAGEHAAKSG